MLEPTNTSRYDEGRPSSKQSSKYRIPNPPILKELRNVEDFLNKRREYLSGIADINRSLSQDAKIEPVSLVDSLDYAVYCFVIRYGILEASEPVRDTDIKQYLQSFVTRKRQVDIDSVFKEISCDMSIDDPELRIADMWVQWERKKKDHELDFVFDSEEGVKMWMSKMTKCLKPSELRESVERSIRDPTQFANIQDPVRFHRFVVKEAVQTVILQQKQKQTRRESVLSDNRNRQVTIKFSAHETPSHRRISRKRRGASNLACLKCGRTDHILRKCRKASETEKVLLLKMHREQVRNKCRRLGMLSDHDSVRRFRDEGNHNNQDNRNWSTIRDNRFADSESSQNQSRYGDFSEEFYTDSYLSTSNSSNADFDSMRSGGSSVI